MDTQHEELKKMIADLGTEVSAVRSTVSKINRKMQWASFYGLLKLVIIIGPLIWAYFFFQPQIQEFYTTYGAMMQQLQGLQGMSQQGSGPALNEDALKNLQRQYPQFFK